MSALHLLDDFIESIETLPSEIQQQLQLLQEKDIQIEELKKNLFKKRSVLLKANEKNFDESVQISLKKRAEKEAQKVSVLLDEKIQIQGNLLQIVEQHQQRLIKEVYKPLDLAVEPNYQAGHLFNDIPEPQMAGGNNKKSSNASNLTTPIIKQAQIGNISSSLSSISSNGSLKSDENLQLNSDQKASRSGSPRPPLLTISTEQIVDGEANGLTASQKVSPKKRASLADEPVIDPNEPVYCYCKQVSWGEMVACDGSNCPREWFHLSCVNLTSPPEGKWYCNECKNKLK